MVVRHFVGHAVVDSPLHHHYCFGAAVVVGLDCFGLDLVVGKNFVVDWHSVAAVV